MTENDYKILIVEKNLTTELIQEYHNVPKEVVNAVKALIDDCLDYVKGLAENANIESADKDICRKCLNVEETDGSHCYECIKGKNKFKAESEEQNGNT